MLGDYQKFGTCVGGSKFENKMLALFGNQRTDLAFLSKSRSGCNLAFKLT